VFGYYPGLQAAQLRKTVRRAEKISTYAEAFSLGEKMSDTGDMLLSKDCGCDM